MGQADASGRVVSVTWFGADQSTRQDWHPFARSAVGRTARS